MKKIFLLILIMVLLIFGIFICVYPKIEFYSNNHLYMMSYGKDWDTSEDLMEIEQEFCYDESYSYNKKRNISITGWDYEGFLIFKWFKVSYKKGNLCATEYLLEENYINNFLKNAKIESNEDNIDLDKLIEGKDAIVGNKRYTWNDNYSYIGYVLYGKYTEMYVYRDDELLIIQVGSSDEGPKYIAYK